MGGMIGTLASAVEGGIKGGSGGGPSKKRKKDDDELPSYHKGGRVRRTGKAKLKKGEVVLTRKQAKKRSRK